MLSQYHLQNEAWRKAQRQHQIDQQEQDYKTQDYKPQD